MLMMMVMVMMLIQIVTVLRYVEKASLCGHGRFSKATVQEKNCNMELVRISCHLKHTPEITHFLVPVAMPEAIPLDTQSDT